MQGWLQTKIERWRPRGISGWIAWIAFVLWITSLTRIAVIAGPKDEWFGGSVLFTGWTTLGIAVVSAISLIRFRVSSAWLVLGGGLLGIAGLL